MVYPVIKLIEKKSVVIMEEKEVSISVGENWNEWVLMAVVEYTEGEKTAVFETFADRGEIAYISKNGVELSLMKTSEDTSWNETEYYLGHTKEEVFSTMKDILGNELLAEEKEPDGERIKNIFPAIQKMKYWKFGDEAPHTYIGSKWNADVIPLYYDGTNGSGRINILYITQEVREAIADGKIKEGLIGGWLPVVRMIYPVTKDSFWEAVMFAKTRYDCPLIQPAWYRFAKISKGRIASIHYFDSYLPYPVKTEPDPWAFYRDLYLAYYDWNEWMPKGMEIDLPEEWISDFCRHALVLEIFTRNGEHPRYGLINKNYGSAEHDGFMDILTSSVECYMEWGMFDTARKYFVNYFTYFIKDNGNVMYRGPSIGRFAKILADLAQYYEYTEDDTLILHFDEKICAIINMLRGLLEKGREKSLNSPEYGLIGGRNEADMNYISDSNSIFEQEPVYFSINATAWRAFRDLGRVLIKIGEKRQINKYCRLGREMSIEAESLNENIRKSVERSLLYDRGEAFLPTIAGSDKYYYDYPYRSCPDSFDDNREWCEIMQAGNMSKDTIQIILNDARQHQGMKLGIFSNRENIVAFISYGEAYGLIQHDMIKEFLMFYYTHLYHLNTRGTWTGFECVDMDRERGESCSYCVPAQLTIPTVTKWMLVFEDPLEDILYLAKATPESYLEQGKCIKVRNAPTRWGKVSYHISSDIDNQCVNAKITFSKKFQCRVYLRLRIPKKAQIKEVFINQKKWERFNSNTVELFNDVEENIVKVFIL